MPTDNERFVRVFERAGADYQRLARPFIDSVAGLVADRALEDRPTSLIDLATGPGTVLAACERRGSRAPATGIDLAERQLQVARKNLAPAKTRVRFARMDAGALQLADNNAGAVTASLALPYFDDPLRAIREAARIAAPGARVVFSTFGHPILGDAGPRLRAQIDRAGVQHGPDPAAHTTETLAQWAFRADLQDVVIEEHDIPVRYDTFDDWWAACEILAFLVRLEDQSPAVLAEIQNSLRDDDRVVGPTGEVAQLVRVCLLCARAR